MKNYIRPILFGFLRIRLEGDSPERFLNMCVHHHLNIWGLRPSKSMDAYEFYMMSSGYEELAFITKKTGTHARVLGHYGIPCHLKRYKGRKWLILGLLLCIMIPFILTGFLWNITITGNKYRTSEALTECLKSQDITIGKRISQIDCQEVIRVLRHSYEDIIWANAYIKGSSLYIRIKENPNPYVEENNEGNQLRSTLLEDSSTIKQGFDLVAPEAGKVTSIITRRGTPQVHKGDQVKKGQILVLGRVDTIGDDQSVQGSHYVKADADVYIESQMLYEDEVKQETVYKELTDIKKEQYIIRIGKTRIQIGSMKKTFKPYIVNRKLSPVFSNILKIPISIEVNRMNHYREKPYYCSEKDRKKKLNEHFQQFCRELDEKGVVITENNVKILVYTDCSKAKGLLKLNQLADSYKQTKEMPIKATPLEEGE